MPKHSYHFLLAAAALFFSACSAPAARVLPMQNTDTEKETAENEQVHLDQVVLKQTTDSLEYSQKETDPLKLVTCSNDEVTVTTSDHLDLSAAGEQEITYVLHYNDSEREVKKTFVVEDTKAPVIRLNEQERTIENGESYDPYANIISVTDPVDGDLKRAEGEENAGVYRIEGNVNSSQPGTYVLKVIAADRNGNESTDTFRVTVKEAPAPEPVQAAAPSVPTHDYIANANTLKFHYPDCSSVNKMKESNKVYYYDVTRDDMIAMGYDPCGRCNP